MYLQYCSMPMYMYIRVLSITIHKYNEGCHTLVVTTCYRSFLNEVLFFEQKMYMYTYSSLVFRQLSTY